MTTKIDGPATNAFPANEDPRISRDMGMVLWPSAEDWPTYYALRARYGQRLSIDDAPAHLIGRGEDAAFREILDVLIEVSPGQVSGSGVAQAGWTRLRVEENGGSHILVVFRLQPEASQAEIDEFLMALDSARMTPSQAVALGGPELGEVGEILVDLSAGLYILACVTRNEDGHRHAVQGEWACRLSPDQGRQ